MGGAPVDVLGDEHLEAMEEFIAAATEGLAASLLAEYGAFNCKVERASGLAFGGMLHIPLAASQGEQPGISAALYFDGHLLSALATQRPVEDASGKQKPPIDPLNLGLVMDVELNVSLRFGQRQLPLREVLELASGSVIDCPRRGSHRRWQLRLARYRNPTAHGVSLCPLILRGMTCDENVD
jgi:flagellar motor switch protein FliN/FliY